MSELKEQMKHRVAENLALIKGNSGMAYHESLSADGARAMQLDLQKLVKTVPDSEQTLLEELKESNNYLDN